MGYPDRSRRDWKARPAVIIAPGPSLTQADVDIVRAAREADRVRVVSVSNAWKFTSPWADVFFAGDRRYWMAYLKGMLDAGVPREKLATCCNVTAKSAGIAYWRASAKKGLGTYELTTGGNSGWMGLNLAFLLGARRFYLLGFDMMRGPAGESHVDGDHVKSCNVALQFGEWIHRIEKHGAPDLKAQGATVVNCSRRTALRCWERSMIEAELALPQEA